MTRSLLQVSRRALALAMALTALAFSASCGRSMMQQGNGSSYLIVDLLQAAPGATPAVFSSMLSSSVSSATDDIGKVTLRMALRDTVSGLTPTDANAITITGYHVDFVPNTPGAAVPSSFDGSLTGTITSASTSLTFVLVRSQAKSAAPLAGLAAPLFTAANVTFYGHDQTGHAVSVMVSISVTFVS